jgi:hypothetical protein
MRLRGASRQGAPSQRRREDQDFETGSALFRTYSSLLAGSPRAMSRCRSGLRPDWQPPDYLDPAVRFVPARRMSSSTISLRAPPHLIAFEASVDTGFRRLPSPLQIRNAPNRHVKEIAEEFVQSVIGGAVDRGAQRAGPAARYFARRHTRSSWVGNHADVNLDARGGPADHCN